MFKRKTSNMHILLTNDDGIFAPGLTAMHKELAKLGKVTVVAPSDVRSAASHSISLQPVTCEKVDIMGKFEGYSVEGTPGDCVKLAIDQIIDMKNDPVQLVVSGINYGQNLGIHIFYSGTVAAAIEGAFHGIPSVAFSAAYEDQMNFSKSAGYCINVLDKLMPLENGFAVNVNIPPVSDSEPKGIKVLPHASSGYRETYRPNVTDDGQTVFEFTTGNPKLVEIAKGTDTTYFSEGYITVTALKLNLNDPRINRKLENKLGQI